MKQSLPWHVNHHLGMITLSGWTIPIILLLTVMATSGYGASIRPFTSDGCSGFPDGTPWQQKLWLSCCKQHDFAYWKGGTYEQRKNADYELRRCVAKVGEPEIAKLMLAGVRVGGTPYLPTSFRWGYGWPYPRFYGKLSKEELQAIEESLKEQEDKTQP